MNLGPGFLKNRVQVGAWGLRFGVKSVSSAEGGRRLQRTMRWSRGTLHVEFRGDTHLAEPLGPAPAGRDLFQGAGVRCECVSV
jgi:hypothetical protein